MMRIAVSRAGVPIRLTDERWAHIVEEHAELAGMREDVLEAVAETDRVVGGRQTSCWPSECWKRARRWW